MSATTVHVKDIASSTEDKEIRDFFSFCGKITDIDVKTEGATKIATVTFEKETAAKTALLLNNTQLGPAHISVTSDSSSSDEEPHVATNADRDSDEITQEEKPRSRILAEYLAHGYVVGDAALQRAIELDHKHGVSTRFLNTIQNLDSKYHATDRAKATDQSYGISQRAGSLLTGLNSYFEKATSTTPGRKIIDFYTQSQKQVTDIHNEARRLAELKKQEHGGSAYKAAGLEKVFGAEKTQSSDGSSSAAPPAPGSTTVDIEKREPTAPAQGGLGVESSTTIPSNPPA